MALRNILKIDEDADILRKKSREIEIFDLKLLGQIGDNLFRFKVHCSAGTYIRTLFSDIAKRLGTVSSTPVIIRTKSGAFEIKNAIMLNELDGEKNVISIEDLFSSFKFFEVTNREIVKKILNGVKISKQELGFDENEKFFIKIDSQLVGMYHLEEEKLICDVFLAE